MTASPEQMEALAQAVEELANHFASVGDQLNEHTGHVSALVQEVRDVRSQHAGVYDDHTETGDSTSGHLGNVEDKAEDTYGELATAEDTLKGQATVLHQVAQDIRDHAGRIRAALGG